MTAEVQAPEYDERAVFAGRIDILYALGRHYLSLPFAALCLPITLFGGRPNFVPFMPIVLQIAVVIAAEQLTQAYKRRPPNSDPHFWARRYTFVSAIAGATWGVGAFFWFVPNSFPAQAYLSLAFLGMTATEFIARSAHRPAYVAHACFALGPLVAMLFWQGGLYAIMSAALVTFFAAALCGYCSGMGRLLDESIRLRLKNADLVVKLSEEKQDAEAARDASEASTQAKSVFISNISHELRTPLNALLGMAQLLDRAELEKPHRDHVKVMLEAGRGLQMLLDDVIALTRADDDRAREEDCDPAQAARAVARLLQPRAWEKHLRLTVTVGSGLPRVAADPRRIRQILLKLADNALKFTDRGGVEIRVDHEIENGLVRFAVIDTGHGIPPEILPVLFKPFAPGDTSYTRRQQGAGLGLAVVKRVVETSGGETGFESEPGEGSTFWFTIPVASQAQPERFVATAQPGDCAPAPSGLSLLVFADDAMVHMQFAHMLEPFGNHVIIAESIVDAIGRASRGGFDIVIARANDADTLAAAPGVKAPILALLFHGQRAPACADEVLRWPPSTQELYGAIASMCERRRKDAAPEPPPQDSIAAIDAAAFAALEKSLGATTLIEILKSYIETAEQLCRALDQASESANWQDASRIAQDIAGSAGGLGLAAMTTAARGFAQQARENAPTPELRNTAQLIVWEHERVRRALANLYPDLVA
jgi:signal transduction histidine kinase/HPt (histidine-containing phosphotransfer) domain-containing protein/CheY-like chemotaxis protein